MRYTITSGALARPSHHIKQHLAGSLAMYEKHSAHFAFGEPKRGSCAAIVLANLSAAVDKSGPLSGLKRVRARVLGWRLRSA